MTLGPGFVLKHDMPRRFLTLSDVDSLDPRDRVIFGRGDVSPTAWEGPSAARCVAVGAAGGLFWLPPFSTDPSEAEALLWTDAFTLIDAGVLRAGIFTLRPPAGANVRARPEAIQICAPGIEIEIEGCATCAANEMSINLGGGADAGKVSLEITAAVQPEVRFFYGQPIARLKYPLWETAKPTRLRLLADPREPYQPASTRLEPIEAASAFATALRAANGAAVTLTPLHGAGYAAQYDPTSKDGYPVIFGPWRPEVAGLTGRPPLVLGLSGLEYAELSAGTAMDFALGPAYSASFGATGADSGPLLQSDAPGVPQPVNTSYPYPPGAVYFAQPERGALFTPDPGAVEPYLRPLAAPVGTLPSATAAPFPLAPYGLARDDASLLERFEATVLAPARRALVNSVISQAVAEAEGPTSPALVPTASTATPFAATSDGPTGPGPTGPPGPTGGFLYAATPQGLLSTFWPKTLVWETLTLASTGGGAQTLQLSRVSGALRSALLTNNLFLVVSSPEKLQQFCSVAYMLTEQSFATLKREKVSERAIERARPLAGVRYESLAFFLPAIQRALGDDHKSDIPMFLAAAQLFELVIEEWTFQLAPANWSRFGTIMILKFSELPLEQLVEDTRLWTAADQFNDDVEATQRALQEIVAAAKARNGVQSAFDYFIDTVLQNRAVGADAPQLWTGALFLNAVAPLAELPPQLQGLAAGIDPSKFFAHHVGVNLSPLDYDGGAEIRLHDSALFGLIFYQDPEDLHYQRDPYEFKVLTLSILFANSQIASFDSEIELMVGALFGDLATLRNSERGNNLILRGSYQDHSGAKCYVFVQERVNQFVVTSQVLATIEINKAIFSTIVGDRRGSLVQTRFAFWGNLQFREISGFDLFSFGPQFDSEALTVAGKVAFSNLGLRMEFDSSQQGLKPSFEFDASAVAFDLSQSVARPTSLYARFPLTLVAMVQGEPGQSPASLGYLTATTPAGGQTLAYPWFGLQFQLNLGSPGALAAKAGFNATLLAAWAPGGTAPQIFTGVQLPGSSGGKRQIAIEGPLTLNVGPIAFETTSDGEYLLRFRNIALGLLGLQFPPGGQTEIVLFGDPRATSNKTLGWYGAYLKNQGATGSTGASGPSAPLAITKG